MHNCLTIQILRLSKGKLAKKYTSSPSHIIELSIPYYTERNNWQCNFAYLCKLSLLSLSFTIPHKQPCSLSGGVLLPPLKSPQQKPCMPPSKTINYDHSNCRHVVSFWYTIESNSIYRTSFSFLFFFFQKRLLVIIIDQQDYCFGYDIVLLGCSPS